jgi:uncharacterized protein
MLSQRWVHTIAEIMGIYRELDSEVAAFAGRSGMHCPPACGACCLSPHVETTVAEMLPLAALLFDQGIVETTLERLWQGSAICVQYEAQPGLPEKGRCLTYEQRPVLCRLFGYMGSRDKAGQLRYGACKVLHKVEAERIARIEGELKRGALPIPMLSAAHERIAEIGGLLGQDMLPINQALLRAIEIIGLDMQLQDSETDACCQ